MKYIDKIFGKNVFYETGNTDKIIIRKIRRNKSKARS